MANGGTASSVLGLVAAGTTINSIAVAREDSPEDVFGVVFAGIALFGTLAAIGQFYDWRLARAFGFLFLFGSFVFRGEGVLKWFSLVTGSATAPKTAKEKTNG